MTRVGTQSIEVPGWAHDPWPVVMRTAERPDGGGTPPVVWLHGVPTCADDWVPYLEEAGGYAPDLPGFGRSSKRGDGDFTLDGYARFLGAFVDAVGLERFSLVVHDWGAAGLAWAAAHPERIDRLVVMNAVPLLRGYRWHRTARLWRTRGLGEIAVGAITGFALRRLLPEAVSSVAAAHFDQGTQRAILRLYRSAPPEVLAAHEDRLRALEHVPSLVVWGMEDPYIASKYADRYADALGGATVRILPDAGHWPWVDDVAARRDVVGFLRHPQARLAAS